MLEVREARAAHGSGADRLIRRLASPRHEARPYRDLLGSWRLRRGGHEEIRGPHHRLGIGSGLAQRLPAPRRWLQALFCFFDVILMNTHSRYLDVLMNILKISRKAR